MLALRTIGIRLKADELEALRAVAIREDRDPKRQAARLLREGLIRAGALEDQTAEATGSPGPAEASS